MTSVVIQRGTNGAPTVALDTSYVNGTRDGLLGETPMVTEPS